VAGDPHPSPNEDPENHIGEKIPDPWDDDDQKDWTTFNLMITAPAPGEVSG
jgi:hypothetical protein